MNIGEVETFECKSIIEYARVNAKCKEKRITSRLEVSMAH